MRILRLKFFRCQNSQFVYTLLHNLILSITACPDICDVKERGRDMEGVVEQYLTTVKPMHYLYVEPTRCMADIVINSGKNPVAFTLVKNTIQKILDEAE